MTIASCCFKLLDGNTVLYIWNTYCYFLWPDRFYVVRFDLKEFSEYCLKVSRYSVLPSMEYNTVLVFLLFANRRLRNQFRLVSEKNK